MDEMENTRPVPRSRLSKTPSWITLGFLLGALFVLSLPNKDAIPVAKKPVAEAPPVRLERPRLLEIEAVFAEWGRFALWANDTTEVALWDTEKRSYTIFYEVLRSGENTYFRSIPKLTRPILTQGARAKSPLLFTEAEESRREWSARDREITTPAEDPTRGDEPSAEKVAAERAVAEKAAAEVAAAEVRAKDPRPTHLSTPDGR